MRKPRPGSSGPGLGSRSQRGLSLSRPSVPHALTAPQRLLSPACLSCPREMTSILPLEPSLCPAFFIEMGNRANMWHRAQILKHKNIEVCGKTSWFQMIKGPGSPSGSPVQWREDEVFPYSNSPLVDHSMSTVNSPQWLPCAGQWEFSGEQNRSGPWCGRSSLVMHE